MVFVLTLGMVVLLCFAVRIIRDGKRDKMIDEQIRLELENIAEYVTEIGYDLKPVKLAANYAALRCMTDEELAKAADYMWKKEALEKGSNSQPHL